MNRLSLDDKNILITGAAGFIGANLVMRILKENEHCHIIGLDSLNDYYDVKIKEYRIKEIEKAAEGSGSDWTFVKGNIADAGLVKQLFEGKK